MKQHGIHDIKATDNIRAIRCRCRVNYIYKLYYQLITWWKKIRLFVNVVPCKTCSFTVFCQEKCPKKKDKKRVTPGWTDVSGPGRVSFLSRSSMYYITLTLFNLINLLNVVSTNNFSWASNFTSLTTWCTNELRRLELAQ